MLSLEMEKKPMFFAKKKREKKHAKKKTTGRKIYHFHAILRESAQGQIQQQYVFVSNRHYYVGFGGTPNLFQMFGSKNTQFIWNLC
jgi:hypothetical protein